MLQLISKWLLISLFVCIALELKADIQPSFVGTGGSGNTTTASLAIAFPTSPQVDDVFVLTLMLKDITVADISSVPTGFTTLFGPDASSAGGNSRLYLFCKISDGTETGSVTINFTAATTIKLAIMTTFRFTELCGTTFYESESLTGGNTYPVGAPSVAAEGTQRLAISFLWLNEDTLLSASSAFSGETNGDWLGYAFTEASAAPGGTIQIQAAFLNPIETISGGSITPPFAAVIWGIRAFAVVATPGGTGQGPVITGTAQSRSGTTTSHIVDVPTGVDDQLMLCFYTEDGPSSLATFPVGWTSLFSQSNPNSAETIGYYKVAVEPEDSAITVTTPVANTSVAQCLRISLHDNNAPEKATTSGTSTTPNPPLLTPSGGSQRYLWLAGFGTDSGKPEWSALFWSSPFTPLYQLGSLTTQAGSLAAQTFTSTASSQDPGAMSQTSSQEWASFTVSVAEGTFGPIPGGRHSSQVIVASK